MESSLIQSAGLYLLRIIAAIIVILIGRFLAGRARAFVKELLKRPQIDQALSASMEGILVRIVFLRRHRHRDRHRAGHPRVPAAAILSISSAILVVFAIALRQSLANFAATIIFMIYQPFPDRRGDRDDGAARRLCVRSSSSIRC